MVLLILWFIIIAMLIYLGFLGAAYLFIKIIDHLPNREQEKERARKEAEDKKKYPGSKPWI